MSENTQHTFLHKLAERHLFRETYRTSYELSIGTHDMMDNYFDGRHRKVKTA